MKRFLKYVFLFLLPLAAGMLVLLLRPLDKKRAYHYLTNDCEGRGAWIYRRLYESPRAVDIAFLGSSHTINGINDTLIEKKINEPVAEYRTVTNLGYCRLGRNLTYVMLDHLLEAKSPKLVIVEVMADEPTFGHPIFPFLAEGKDVLLPKSALDKSYPDDVYKAVMARLDHAKKDLWKEKYPYTYSLKDSSGFGTNTFVADTKELDRFKDLRYRNQYKSHTWKRNFSMLFPRSYLQAMSELAKQKNVPLVFLYIPPYGEPERIPIEFETYKKYGEVWIAPDSVFTKKENWYDTDHLNETGANALSAWVAEQIGNYFTLQKR
jgi:hypothetical protein